MAGQIPDHLWMVELCATRAASSPPQLREPARPHAALHRDLHLMTLSCDLGPSIATRWVRCVPTGRDIRDMVIASLAHTRRWFRAALTPKKTAASCHITRCCWSISTRGAGRPCALHGIDAPTLCQRDLA
jgi:hypothetical protein